MKQILHLMLLLIVPSHALAQADVMDELAEFVEQYEESWQLHDAENLGRFFADDCDMVVGIQPRMVGRMAVSQWWDGYFSRIDSGRRLTISVESIRLLQPNVALINVETTTGGNHSQTNEILEPRKARGTWVVTSTDGEWKIAALRMHSPIGEQRTKPGTDK